MTASDVERIGWPTKLLGTTHKLSFQLQESPNPARQREIEASVRKVLGEAQVELEWLGRVVDLRIESDAEDLLERLENTVRAIASAVPTSDVRYSGKRPKAAKPRAAPAKAIPKVELVDVDRKSIPKGWSLWYEKPSLPAGLLEKTPEWASRTDDGVWLVIEWARDGMRLRSIREDRPAERHEIVVPRGERKQELVLSPDGRRALSPHSKGIIEVSVPTLKILREIPVPRTSRDNNGWTSVAYHADPDRLVVGTETGLYILSGSGEQKAFVKCLDILELAATPGARLTVVSQNDPTRGELFGISGDEIRSLAKFKPLGSTFARGDRLFAHMSPKRTVEVVGGEAAFRAAFGEDARRS
jgi:hypothetical protein